MSKNYLGFTLFALVTLSAITLSSSNWLPAVRNLPLRLGSMFKKRKSRDKELLGDLIITGSSRFRSNFWKFLSSSVLDNQPCDIEITNETNEVYLLCWVKPDGSLTNYYPINDDSIRDGSVSNQHKEGTSTNHVFVCIRPSTELPKHISDIDPSKFIFCYRPLQADLTHTLKLTINQQSQEIEIALDSVENDKEIIDSSSKEYDHTTIHGFTVFYEPSLSTTMPELFDVLDTDLQMVCKLLPKDACLKLQNDTFFWINKNLTYGTRSQPVVGREMCFHPSAEWLRSNGLSELKAGCIEMFQAAHYINGRDLWGVGGVLLHELSHAYHCKHCPDGYDCVQVREAYMKAMASGLYERVAVKGRQGASATDGRAKAYACTNCMEFFAELSVAFLYQPELFMNDQSSTLHSQQQHQQSIVAESKFSTSDNESKSNSKGSSSRSKHEGKLDSKDSKLGGKSTTSHESIAAAAAAAPSESKRSTDDNVAEAYQIKSTGTAATEEDEGGFSNHDYNKWYPFNASQLRQHDPHSHTVLESLWRPKGT